MNGRYFCFTIVVRVNQIEVAPGINLGKDECGENTLENLIAYRSAIAAAIPGARITIAFSHEALTDKSENFTALRLKAKEYHDLYGDDVTYMLGAYFSGAYSPREAICSHVDEALFLLRSFMGRDYLPACVVGGFVPARVMEHIASLGIHTVQGVIFSQYAIDNQDGDGSMCYPYYPSKEHFCKPAQAEEDFIDVAVLDGWTVDFINATYAGFTKEGYNSRMGCGPIETLRPFGEEKGIEVIADTAAQMFEESYALNNNFGFATAIWELCLIEKNGHHSIGIDGKTVQRLFCRLKERFPDMQVVTFGEVGEMFRAAHRNNDSVCYRFTHRGNGTGGSLENLRIEWYMNKYFRMAVRTDMKTGESKVIDFTDYTKPACEPPDSDYAKGIIHRNWSLLGDINQKGLRVQDTPVCLDELTDEQKTLIKRAQSEFGFKVL
ncbi:MAG: DUF3863 domain-containing protein [Clostridia bacterium]|nr:DUF3863 domain-containing protein [Clostridia bacterium]